MASYSTPIQGVPSSMILMNWKEIAFSSFTPLNCHTVWLPLPPGRFKLNFDGSAMGNPSNAGFGGVIRESNETPILFLWMFVQ